MNNHPKQQESQFLIIESHQNPKLNSWLNNWLASTETHNSWFLDCNRKQSGVWSGVRDIFLKIIDDCEGSNDQLISKYDYELYAIAKDQENRITPRFLSLTDTSNDEERVRNYPMDRAVRIVNGLIDLLDEWLDKDKGPLSLVLNNLDHASDMSLTFFRELMRRRQQSLKIRFAVVCQPGKAEDMRSLFDNFVIDVKTFDFALTPVVLPPIEVTRARFEFLRGEINGGVEPMLLYPELIRLAELLDERAAGLKAHVGCMSWLVKQGYYKDAYYHAEITADDFDSLVIAENDRLSMVLNHANSLVAMGEIEKGYDILKNQGYEQIKNPVNRSNAAYLLAMLHTRFLPERNTDEAERYLKLAHDNLAMSSQDQDQKTFMRVFLDNGLALVRCHQRRPEDAIELCQRGFETLTKDLTGDQHKLHRSVLLYNIAQVYINLKENTLGIEYLSRAMDMDPNYGEYYNERGNIYQGNGLYQEALDDYEKAIELSAPFYEVFFNIGLCYYKIGQLENALKAFARSLDLNPEQAAIYATQAAIFEEIEDFDSAVEQYNKALELEKHSDYYGCRAILFYQMGKINESLSDMNDAIGLDSDRAEFYQNRAVAYQDLGYTQDAVKDLQSYLKLWPDAPDHDDVRKQLSLLTDNDVVIA